MLLFYPGEASDLRLCRITLDDEVVGLDWILTLDHAVQAGEAELVDLPALGFNSVLERAMAEFLRQRSSARDRMPAFTYSRGRRSGLPRWSTPRIALPAC